MQQCLQALCAVLDCSSEKKWSMWIVWYLMDVAMSTCQTHKLYNIRNIKENEMSTVKSLQLISSPQRQKLAIKFNKYIQVKCIAFTFTQTLHNGMILFRDWEKNWEKPSKHVSAKKPGSFM